MSERPLDLVAELAVPELALGRRRRVVRARPLAERLRVEPALALDRAALVLARVHRDAEQPGRELGVAPEAVQLPEDLEEDLLRHVLGVLRVSQEPPGEREDPPSVLVVESLEAAREPTPA